MIDMKQHLIRQMVFSRATFGPGKRSEAVLDHIEEEIREVRESDGSPEEWTDMAILSLDGLTRSIWAGSDYQISADEAAERAVRMILGKQGKNERHEWPEWRSSAPGKAIKHKRGIHD